MSMQWHGIDVQWDGVDMQGGCMSMQWHGVDMQGGCMSMQWHGIDVQWDGVDVQGGRIDRQGRGAWVGTAGASPRPHTGARRASPFARRCRRSVCARPELRFTTCRPAPVIKGMRRRLLRSTPPRGRRRARRRRCRRAKPDGGTRRVKPGHDARRNRAKGENRTAPAHWAAGYASVRPISAKAPAVPHRTPHRVTCGKPLRARTRGARDRAAAASTRPSSGRARS
jgi:hypothetical protein